MLRRFSVGASPGDENDWQSWRAVGDEVLHIELRRWADVLVIAPLSANTLAKAANGLCDNLLTCVVRAWDWQKPLLVRRLLDGSPLVVGCAGLGVHVF